MPKSKCIPPAKSYAEREADHAKNLHFVVNNEVGQYKNVKRDNGKPRGFLSQCLSEYAMVILYSPCNDTWQKVHYAKNT